MKKFVEGQWNPKGNLIAYLKSLKGILYGLFFLKNASKILKECQINMNVQRQGFPSLSKASNIEYQKRS